MSVWLQLLIGAAASFSLAAWWTIRVKPKVEEAKKQRSGRRFEPRWTDRTGAGDGGGGVGAHYGFESASSSHSTAFDGGGGEFGGGGASGSWGDAGGGDGGGGGGD